MTATTSFERYQNKTVLVTGLTGFKGQWLGRWLKRLGAEVVGLGLPPTPDPFSRPRALAPEFDCRTIDVRDSAAVTSLMKEVEPEIVFHLAAQALVRPSYADPVATFATNVMGTAHLLDAARQVPAVRAVVVVTSDKCYENREWHWSYREEEPLGGFDPYSASKACAELVASAYRRSFVTQENGLQIATARAGNVMGGGDWAADRLIPDIVRAILADRPVLVRRPMAVRPWQHVLEALSGYLLLGAGLLHGDGALSSAWNFGPPDGDVLTVGDLASRVIQRWGRGQMIVSPTETGPHEARYLKLDSSKARAELPWEALLSMEERLDWTIDWYEQWSQSPELYCTLMDEQIERYERKYQAWVHRRESYLQALPGSLAPHSHAA